MATMSSTSTPTLRSTAISMAPAESMR